MKYTGEELHQAFTSALHTIIEIQQEKALSHTEVANNPKYDVALEIIASLELQSSKLEALLSQVIKNQQEIIDCLRAKNETNEPKSTEKHH